MTVALGVWRALRRGAGRDSPLPAVLALVAFAVTTAALLVCSGGLLVASPARRDQPAAAR